MATLREAVEDIIKAHGENVQEAAIAVCKMLEDEIGLAGNGWFDGDEVMLAALKE